MHVNAHHRTNFFYIPGNYHNTYILRPKAGFKVVQSARENQAQTKTLAKQTSIPQVSVPSILT